jgi:hypothetical protein
MATDRYNVVFSGELAADLTPDLVRRNLRAWFRLDDAQLDTLLSGDRIIVKHNVDMETAKRVQVAFRKAGGKALIEPTAPGPAPKPAQEGGLTLAPPGAPLDEIDDRGPPQTPDTSGLSLVAGPEWSLADCEPPAPEAPHLDLTELELVPISEPRGGRER